MAHIKGQRSHDIITDASHLLCCMDHRGARGADANSGDGAGILTALPHEFLTRVARDELNSDLPPAGEFAAGLVFLPTDAKQRDRCKAEVAEICAAGGSGWWVGAKYPPTPMAPI